ncbi:DNA -binding domain-containing protein [Hoeflea sp.]|uniref:DNA -binding domain-containing protein n=1 Tax=Hoeflea sp. TaxID=1940281 RepID=UPI003B02C035
MSERTVPDFVDAPPLCDFVTDYDRAQVRLYARLLDAEADGAALAEIARILFGIDAQDDPERARNVHDRHLARARWMAQNGYRDLLNGHTA